MKPLLARMFIRDHKNVTDPRVRTRYGTMSGVVGIVVNILLCALKLTFGILTGAVSILADAINNLSDSATSIVSLVGFRLSGKPADREHPFGHGRIEYVAGLIVAIAIIVMGVEIITQAVGKIIEPTETTFTVASMIVLGVCILVKLWLGFFNLNIARTIDSSVARATAKDSFSDCISTAAVLAGVLVGYFTGVDIDAYLGIAVGILVLVGGALTTKDCLSPLLGIKPSKELIDEIRTKVLSHPEIIGIHDLIVHDYGPGRKIVSLHAEVRADADFLKIHDTIDLIERELKETYHCDTTIHMDPIDVDDEFTNGLRMSFARLAHGLGEVSIHDLRVVRGETHTNIIFDCVVPFGYEKSEAEVKAYFADEAKKLDPNYFVVVSVEQSLSE